MLTRLLVALSLLSCGTAIGVLHRNLGHLVDAFASSDEAHRRVLQECAAGKQRCHGDLQRMFGDSANFVAAALGLPDSHHRPTTAVLEHIVRLGNVAKALNSHIRVRGRRLTVSEFVEDDEAVLLFLMSALTKKSVRDDGFKFAAELTRAAVDSFVGQPEGVEGLVERTLSAPPQLPPLPRDELFDPTSQSMPEAATAGREKEGGRLEALEAKSEGYKKAAAEAATEAATKAATKATAEAAAEARRKIRQGLKTLARLGNDFAGQSKYLQGLLRNERDLVDPSLPLPDCTQSEGAVWRVKRELRRFQSLLSVFRIVSLPFMHGQKLAGAARGDPVMACRGSFEGDPDQVDLCLFGLLKKTKGRRFVRIVAAAPDDSNVKLLLGGHMSAALARRLSAFVNIDAAHDSAGLLNVLLQLLYSELGQNLE